jgi:hypothetical protein
MAKRSSPDASSETSKVKAVNLAYYKALSARDLRATYARWIRFGPAPSIITTDEQAIQSVSDIRTCAATSGRANQCRASLRCPIKRRR